MTKKIEILNKIDTGEITPEEGIDLLSNAAVDNNLNLPSTPKSQMEVLEEIDRGEISLDEGIAKLEGHKENIIKTSSKENIKSGTEASKMPDMNIINKWKMWWMIPMGFGVLVTTATAVWMNAIYQSSGIGFWFFVSWLPFMIGIFLVILGWSSKNGPWLHVRVTLPNEEWPRRIAISFPLPIRFTAWCLRNFGQFIPFLDSTSIDEIILALEHTSSEGNPFYVTVNEGNGETVEVYIG